MHRISAVEVNSADAAGLHQQFRLDPSQWRPNFNYDAASIRTVRAGGKVLLRKLPTATDAELVFEIGRYLDGHGKSMPVSMVGARAVLRERVAHGVRKRDLDRLLVEMCATRGLAVIFDDGDLTERR